VSPSRAALWTPLWLPEPACCVWRAVLHPLLGRMPYGSQSIRVAAQSNRRLEKRLGRVSKIGPGVFQYADAIRRSPDRAKRGGMPSDVSAPVIVVGAGLAGLACAQRLSEAGVAVQIPD
jgi:hypothetical protein